MSNDKVNVAGLQRECQQMRDAQLERDLKEERDAEGIGCVESLLLGLVGLGSVVAMAVKAVMA